MKKYLLATCLTLVAVPAQAADELNCANIPDTECADLGFVQDTTKCSGYPSLKCPFDSTQVYCGDVCYVGAILYSDGKCYERTQTNKEVVGVVFDMENRLAVSLNLKDLPWGGDGTDITALENHMINQNDRTYTYLVKTTYDTNGKANTAAIVAQLGDTSDYAAGYCYTLTEGDKTSGSWWLPSLKELYTMYLKKTTVNAGLSAIGGTIIEGNPFYLSSLEAGSSACWMLPMNSSNANGVRKNVALPVRCITSF